MKRMKLFIAIISLTLFLTGVFAISGTAQAVELKFGHVGAPGSLFQISVDEFAKRVNAEVDGESKWSPLVRASSARTGSC